MKPLAETNRSTGSSIWKGLIMAVVAGFVIAITLVLIGLIGYYSTVFEEEHKEEAFYQR